MPKIVNFKLEINEKSVLNQMNKRENVDEENLDRIISLREKVKSYVRKGLSLLRPATVYETLEKSQVDKIGELMDELINGNLGLTIFVVTVGKNIDKEISEEHKSGDKDAAMILDIIGNMALDHGVKFVKRLISEEANSENCNIELWIDNLDDGIQQSLARFVPLDKVGVSIDKSGGFSPARSVLGLLKWTAIGD